jgi:hypothetical protein
MSYSSQENVSICGVGKYSTFREDSRRRKLSEDNYMKKTAPLLILASMAFAPAAFSAPAGTLSVHILDPSRPGSAEGQFFSWCFPVELFVTGKR